jgi:putative transposase
MLLLGWSMESRMKAQLVCDALTMAIWQQQLKVGLVGSMSKRVCYWDNAVADSFFGSLKQKRVH